MERRTILVDSGLQVDMDVRSDVGIVFCPDPRFRASHKVLIRRGLNLGQRDEEYVPLPVLGGGAVLAHPQYFTPAFELIRESMRVVCQHFGVSHLVLIGHEHCKHLGNFHLEVHGDSDPEHVLRDMIEIRRMFNEQALHSKCPVRKMFAEFNVALDIIYMRTPSNGKLDYDVIH